MRYCFSLLFFGLAGCWPVAAQLIGLPPTPALTASGYQLILDFEVGGGRPYYQRYLQRPTWPGAASGVTVGVGYDLGYNSKAVILSDWASLPETDRLAAVAGVKGLAAKSRVAAVRDILVEWNLAEGVFNRVTLARFWQLTARTFPGFEGLHPNCQAALLSLTFNRGNSLSGPRRAEMREIARLTPLRDYNGIAAQFRAMKRLWRGQGVDGLLRRRDAEARLVETCIQ